LNVVGASDSRWAGPSEKEVATTKEENPSDGANRGADGGCAKHRNSYRDGGVARSWTPEGGEVTKGGRGRRRRERGAKGDRKRRLRREG
jgi:hypothetical protein